MTTSKARGASKAVHPKPTTSPSDEAHGQWRGSEQPPQGPSDAGKTSSVSAWPVAMASACRRLPCFESRLILESAHDRT